MSDIRQKTIITIFSTKTIGEEECLFGKDAKTTTHNEQEIFLHNYFSRNIKVTKQLEHILKSEDGQVHLRILFQEKLKKQKEEFGISAIEDLMTEGDKSLKSEFSLDDNEVAINERISDEIKKQMIIDLYNRVEKWNLRTEVIGLCEGSEEWNKVLKKSNMYQIGSNHVYALHCLEEEDMDIERNQWIPCLVQCARALTGQPANGVVIQLVLHDAEFGKNTQYTKHDVMVLEKKEDVVRDFPSVNNYLEDNDECSILFFQHTTNPVTKILRTPVDDNNGDCVHENVRTVILSYGEFGKLIKDSNETLDSDNGIDASKSIDKKLIELTKKM